MHVLVDGNGGMRESGVTCGVTGETVLAGGGSEVKQMKWTLFYLQATAMFYIAHHFIKYNHLVLNCQPPVIVIGPLFCAAAN